MKPDLIHRRFTAVLTFILVGATTPVSSQERAVVMLAQGGYQIPFTNLSDQGDELRSGWMAGGGLGLQLSAHIALRGTALFGGSGYRGSGLSLTESGFHRTFVSLDLQTGLPTTAGWTPYAFAGGGLARINPGDDDLEGFTNFAARFGMGTNYVLENRFLSLLLEFGGVVYQFNAYGFSGYQFDMQILAGVAYAIPL